MPGTHKKAPRATCAKSTFLPDKFACLLAPNHAGMKHEWRGRFVNHLITITWWVLEGEAK